MKDLITSIASVMILMVFVMQFCSNQVLASKILMLDEFIDNIIIVDDEGYDEIAFEKAKVEIGKIFGCKPEAVFIDEQTNKVVVKVPIKNVIACGDFLGIKETENTSVYKREVYLK